MTISREWATPLTIGAFLLMACTGILMFFHWDTGLNKEAHEWLGWAMVAGVVLHGVANWSALKRHLARGPALAMIGVFVAILAASFFIQPEKAEGNPAFRTMGLVMQAPLSDVAALSRQTPDELTAKLTAAGFTVQGPSQTLSDITGPERGRQFKALAAILPPASR
jgi:hypothetical protein